MEGQLEPQGRFRRWLGRRLVGDETAGNLLWRRIMHGLGALVLVYFVFPTNFFVIAPKEYVLLAVLAAAVLLEVLRHAGAVELPTIRPYEKHRVASFVYYALALAGAVLLLPVPIAAAVVLGTALVDPIAGGLRASVRFRAYYPAVPFVVYVGLAFVGMGVLGGWPTGWALVLALPAAVVALAAEYPKYPWLDDDLVMTFAPAIFLYAVGVLALGLPT